MLSLSPEAEGKLHPEALKHFYDCRADIQREVPLEELSDDDLDMYLRDDEKREFESCMKEIGKALLTCADIGDGNSHQSFTDDIILVQFKIHLLSPMFKIKLLLKRVYDRKVERAREEQKKREEKERQQAERVKEEQRKREEAAEAERREKEEEKKWRAARKAVNPPTDDAKRYLDRPGEYDKFIQAALEAIEVNMEKGQDYLNDSRTFDYRWCLKKINDRKEEERQKIAANFAAQEYNRRLNEEKARLKALLCPNRKDHESYFKKQIKDHRYAGENFTQFLSSEEEQDFDKTIVDIGRKKLDEILSSDFRQFIDGKCWRSYFLLPSAEYSLEGVPCLDFMFDVFAIVEVRVWLKPGQKNFGDYVFNLPRREEKGYSVLLQEPEFLGYHYLVLTPKDLGGYSFWQSIPLVLLKGLLNGETKPNGTTISAASDGMITYKTPKFKEEVTIPDSFAGYLKNIGNIDQMVSMGIITEKVGSIVKSELGELKIEHEASPLEDRIKQKGTKKAKAFQLFSEGKDPTSPEVKALGMHKSTRFKYYNQYVAEYKP